MNVKKDGKLLTVSDRPYLLWAIGLAILLFSLVLVVRAATLLTKISGSGLLSILATATIFWAFGFWFSKQPLTAADLVDRFAVFFVDDVAFYFEGGRHFAFVD